MIEIYADGKLVSDSRLEECDLIGLKRTSGLNKGGTAEIIMPPGHPAYGAFVGYRTIVEIYRDHVLKFRGRALYPTDDFYRRRTLVCEGELCFFQDALVRPYLYQETPAGIFESLVNTYNSQVEPFKRFQLGTVNVTDPNDYIRLENGNAESVLSAINKLLERCGGYIVFTTNESGARVVNWLVEVNTQQSQVIELGENLFDLSRSDASADLATVIVPYGAPDEITGERVTIESVNGEKDYIQDDDAVALRGTIVRAVTWDDVTEPANLLRKAREYLEISKNIITSLTVTALDLSYIDKSVDSFEVGDTVRVRSAAHGIDERFQLVEQTEDLLRPENSYINLGKEIRSLTGLDVAGDNRSLSELQKVTNQITADYNTNIANVMQETERALISLIEQTSEAIKLEVAQTYTTNDQLTESISSSMTQLANQFLFEFETLRTVMNEADTENRSQLIEIYKYISFDNGDIKLGTSDSAITLTIENDMIVFKKNGVQFGWWDGVDFHTGNIVVEVNERAQFGNFAFVPRSNGSLSFLKVGG
jgi:phage minor structural protein